MLLYISKDMFNISSVIRSLRLIKRATSDLSSPLWYTTIAV